MPAIWTCSRRAAGTFSARERNRPPRLSRRPWPRRFAGIFAFEEVNTRFEDIARTLGASEWRVFRTISLPLTLRGVAAGAVLAFARAMGEFGATAIVAGMIPRKTMTIRSRFTKTRSSSRRRRLAPSFRFDRHRLHHGLLRAAYLAT
ncbi:MAG: ABC transporter permease subunit [Chthoniobacterales bacterium]|nr:ABC transporter permease subunit [Chthoniobacterales bacterium]